MPSSRYLCLDGLRGIAAMAVMAGHCSRMLGTPMWQTNTALAVDFFFMLSGFVLMHAYRDRLERRDGFKPYIVARIIRLYPLIIFSTALAGLCVMTTNPASSARTLVQIVQGMALVPAIPDTADAAWGRAIIMPINPPAWSLFFEMIASLLFGLGLWRRGALGWPTMIAGATLAAGVAILGGIDVGFSYATLLVGLARVSFGFGVGAILHRCRHLVDLPRPSFVAVGVVLLAALLAPGNGRFYALLCLFVILPALLTFGMTALPRGRRVAHWSGELSYPLYLLHWPVLLMVKAVLPRTGLKPESWGVFAGTLAATLAVSWLALIAYDRPVRRWLNTAYNARHRRPASLERTGAP